MASIADMQNANLKMQIGGDADTWESEVEDSEVRSQKSEGRSQRSEVRGQRSGSLSVSLSE